MLSEKAMLEEAASVQKPETEKQDPMRLLAAATAAVFSVAVCVMILVSLALSSGTKSVTASANTANVTIMDKFDMYMTNEISSALDGVLAIEKVYWLNDSDQVAPEPNPANYGEATSEAELAWLLEEAKDLIGGQKMLFGTGRPIWEGDTIHYYYDETILVITWKEIIDRSVYTMSEVKVAHPSQFRRFLAGGEFGSDKQYVTTEMAQSVNAVVASSGDFYKFRHYGAVVYERELERFEGHWVDSCFINDDGNLLFAYRDQLKTEEDARKFIEENNVRFSLAFGPVLVDNGEIHVTNSYPLGEITGEYSRAAICQMDDLHYLLVNISQEGGYGRRQTIANFAKRVHEMGVEKAYALDGGQTTVIAMDGQLVSIPDFGTQRRISDIIYFATALPNGG